MKTKKPNLDKISYKEYTAPSHVAPCTQQVAKDSGVFYKLNICKDKSKQERLVRRKGASWSLNWPSGANSLAHLQLTSAFFMCLCDCCVLVFLCFWESIN